MNVSPIFRRGLLISLVIHGGVIAGGLLSVDGSDRLIANTIEIHLTIPEQVPSLKPKETPMQKDALVSIPKNETFVKPIPQVLPVIVAKPKIESKPLPELEPEPHIVEKVQPIPDIALTPDTPSVDATEAMVQVAAIESQDVIDQKEIDAIIEAERHYRDEVIRLIESKKYYPKRLQKMRKEGDVLVAFTLNRNGSVRALEVVNAKGAALFKKAALKAVQSAALFPSFPGKSSRETWSFRIPLSYRLLRS